jgi:integrase/recombinase XerD
MARSSKKTAKQEPAAPPAAPWFDSLKAFTRYLAEERRPKKTAVSYLGDLKAFQLWYQNPKAMGEELIDVGQVTARVLRQWQDDMDTGKAWALTEQGGKVAFTTINRRLSGLATFLKWAYYHGLIPRLIDPPKRIKGPRNQPRWLTRKEKLALLDAIEHAPPRDRAVILILLHTGLRIHELSNLTWEDVTLQDRKGTLKIRGKGGKYRKVPVNLDCREALMALGWAEHRGTARRVVVGERRGQLGCRGLQGIADRYGKKAGIKGFTAHQLRHTCAHDLREEGIPMERVATFMGHSSLDTTRLYLESSDDDLQGDADKLSRRSRPRP